MAKRVELIFDFAAPNAYMVWWPLRDMVKRLGAEIDVTPVFLGGMHRLTGNAPPMIRDKDVKGKVEYAALEMERFIKRHELTRFRLHPQLPFNSITLQRMLLAVEQDGRAFQFIEALLPAIWEDGIDINDPGEIASVIEDAGFDERDLFKRSQTEEIKEGLKANTEHAVERGAFGIPTMFVGPKGGDTEMFFGKERLEQIEEELVKG